MSAEIEIKSLTKSQWNEVWDQRPAVECNHFPRSDTAVPVVGRASYPNISLTATNFITAFQEL